MRILLFLNSLIPVSNYGGTQRVMWSLGKALTQMGHKVYFLAKAGSTCDFASVIPYDVSCLSFSLYISLRKHPAVLRDTARRRVKLDSIFITVNAL